MTHRIHRARLERYLQANPHDLPAVREAIAAGRLQPLEPAAARGYRTPDPDPRDPADIDPLPVVRVAQVTPDAAARFGTLAALIEHARELVGAPYFAAAQALRTPAGGYSVAFNWQAVRTRPRLHPQRKAPRL